MSACAIWTCCWFITVSVCMFIDAKTRQVQGSFVATKDEKTLQGFVALLIWIAGIVAEKMAN